MTSLIENARPHRADQAQVPGAAAPATEPPARWRVALLALIALGFGLSGLDEGLYSVTQWGPIAFGALALLFTLLVAAPAPLSRPALVALAGLLGLAVWSLLSALWAESADQAVLEGNRYVLYAATFAVLLLLVRDARLARLALACTTAAVLGVTAYILAAMLIGDASKLFLSHRLFEPLGYANGQAAYLLLGLWPLVALAETAHRRLIAALAMSGAFLLVALLAASQTRAVLPALLVAAAVLLAAVPGRVRRAWALLTLLGGVAAAWPALLGVYQETTPEALRTAAWWMLAGAALVGLAWAFGGRAIEWVAANRSVAPASLARIGGAVAALVAIGVLAVAIASVSDPRGTLERKLDEFTELRVDPASTRFLSAGGVRHDFWRIALIEFEDSPAKGVGAGNYRLGYHVHRRTSEDIRQPHSLELQVLAELGVVGLIVLLVFISGPLLGLARTARRAKEVRIERFLAVGGGGTFLVWLVHTSVDWLHLFPGLTGIALVAAATLVRPDPEGARRSRVGGRALPRRVPGVALGAAAAVAIAVAGVLVGRQTVAEAYRRDGREALATERPQEALRKANVALSLNDESVEAYYLKAAALARLNAYGESRQTLLEARAREPSNFVTWALLGDLSLRAGDYAGARRAYLRALALNPRERVLRDALADPRLSRAPRATGRPAPAAAPAGR